MRDEIDLTPTLGRLNLLAPADQLALDPQDLAKGPNPAKAPVQLDDASARFCCVFWSAPPVHRLPWMWLHAGLAATAGCRACCSQACIRHPAPCRSGLPTCPPSTPSLHPSPQLNLVVVLDGPQPKLLPNFDVGPLRLGWSINIDGTYVSGFLE